MPDIHSKSYGHHRYTVNWVIDDLCFEKLIWAVVNIGILVLIRGVYMGKIQHSQKVILAVG